MKTECRRDFDVLLAELRANLALYFLEDAKSVCGSKAARAAANKRAIALENAEARIVEEILARPIASLVDVRGLLEFMAFYCQEFVPCPSNARTGDTTRAFDTLVRGIDKLVTAEGRASEL